MSSLSYDDVTEIDANAEFQAAMLGYVSVTVTHVALDLRRTCNGVNNARKYQSTEAFSATGFSSG
jgi:hypothetical protein